MVSALSPLPWALSRMDMDWSVNKIETSLPWIASLQSILSQQRRGMSTHRRQALFTDMAVGVGTTAMGLSAWDRDQAQLPGLTTFLKPTRYTGHLARSQGASLVPWIKRGKVRVQGYWLNLPGRRPPEYRPGSQGYLGGLWMVQI